MQVICARGITLREITENDLPILHNWRNSDHFMTFCSTRRNRVGIDEFKQELTSDFRKDRHVQCLITRMEKPIGTIYSYGLNKTDGYVYITTYLAIGNECKGYGAIALALFMKYLFESFGLYKIYTEAYSYNTLSLKTMRNAGFSEEGVFKGHRLIDGERYDLVRLAFFRDTRERKILWRENMISLMLQKTQAIPQAKSVKRGMMLVMTLQKKVIGEFPKIVMVLMTAVSKSTGRGGRGILSKIPSL